MKLHELRIWNDKAYLTTDGIRPGNHNLSDFGQIINGLHVQTSAQAMNVVLPDGVASQAYGEVYQGGSLTTPSYGINLYNAAGQQIGLAANDEAWRISLRR